MRPACIKIQGSSLQHLNSIGRLGVDSARWCPPKCRSVNGWHHAWVQKASWRLRVAVSRSYMHVNARSGNSNCVCTCVCVCVCVCVCFLGGGLDFCCPAVSTHPGQLMLLARFRRAKPSAGIEHPQEVQASHILASVFYQQRAPAC